VRHELHVTLRVDASPRRTSIVTGELETRYGRQPFAGWLELFGHLEAALDQARDEAGSRPAPGGGG